MIKTKKITSNSKKIPNRIYVLVYKTKLVKDGMHFLKERYAHSAMEDIKKIDEITEAVLYVARPIKIYHRKNRPPKQRGKHERAKNTE